jgi:hypothetical protein
MIPFTCNCGMALHAQDKHVGRLTRCPACGREMDIPGDAGSIQTADAPRAFHPPTAAAEPRPVARKKPVVSLILGALVVTPILVLLVLFPAFQSVGETSTRLRSLDNLKQMAQGMREYHEANGSYPPAAICDPTGKPLLSWRVAILPYVEQGALYNQFKLDEPWDGPNNILLMSRMPRIYWFPADDTMPPGYTNYRVFVGDGAAFEPGRPVDEAEFTDGLSNTILIVEADGGVPWTKPAELPFDRRGSPQWELSRRFRGVWQVATADGGVRTLPDRISEQTLRAAITRNGGEILDPSEW